MEKISTCLWFDQQAEEAVNFYTSVFKNSKITSVTHYGKDEPMPEGMVRTVSFELAGRVFMALNGGPHYKFSPAISFMVNCDTQAEIDEIWEKLSTGEFEECGWVQDKYGIMWQIVPSVLGELMSSPDPARGLRVIQALVQMKKLDIATLQAAYDAES